MFHDIFSMACGTAARMVLRKLIVNQLYFLRLCSDICIDRIYFAASVVLIGMFERFATLGTFPHLNTFVSSILLIVSQQDLIHS